jgi:Fur family transcriptional regulator, ferric uptake regulator
VNTGSRGSTITNEKEKTAQLAINDIAGRGFPVTGQRRLLVAQMMSRAKPFTAEELMSDLRLQRVHIGRATVFRTLDLLAQLGYLHRTGEDNRAAYIACTPDHHHHLVCSNCGQVLHLAGCPIDDMLANLQASTGYQIDRHSLELGGVCPDCQPKARDEVSD